MSLLGIGITSKSLTDLERKLLRRVSPSAVILFGRNVSDPGQLRDLIRDVKSAPRRPPLIVIDEEGGRVDRLRNFLPGLPGAEEFGEVETPSELALDAGQVIGTALRFFDIDADLAPVVDLRGDEAPKGLERRTFGRDVETVVDLAGAFMRGLHAAGAAACLKHFPGIGSGSADPHYSATVIDVSAAALEERDLVPFARLGGEAGAIMIGHGTYPQIDEPDLPATLSRGISTGLLRDRIGFAGLAISDDMEMHAVSDLGSCASIAERALIAGSDLIMFCSDIERVESIHAALEQRSRDDAAVRERAAEALRRTGAYRRHIDGLRAAAPPPTRFEDVAARAARFVERFAATRLREEAVEGDRREEPRPGGTGRTGREEWS